MFADGCGIFFEYKATGPLLSASPHPLRRYDVHKAKIASNRRQNDHVCLQWHGGRYEYYTVSWGVFVLLP